MTGTEQVLIEDWCQQYPSHSVGSVEFGRDGALYASAGDGASFNFVDYGQDGARSTRAATRPAAPAQPWHHRPPRAARSAARTCAPPATRSDSTAPSSGSTRPRVRRLPGNPLAGATDPNARRIIASGLRNPFRITNRPGTDEIWVGDVGWNDWEEINRIISRTDVAVTNFGWPCYEGPSNRQSGYDGANLNICENLYAQAGRRDRALLRLPPHQPGRAERDLPDRELLDRRAGVRVRCRPRTPTRPSTTTPCSSPTTPATASGSCPRVPTASPAPGQVRTFVAGAANPVNLENGPGGDLFYVDFDGGTIRRISYSSANQPPVAVATATPTTGAAPLTVNFDGSGSSDPERRHAHLRLGSGRRRRLRRLDRGPARRTPTPPQGRFTAALRVTDQPGRLDTASVDHHGRQHARRPRRSTPRRPARPGRSATSSPSPARRPTPRTARCPPRR